MMLSAILTEMSAMPPATLFAALLLSSAALERMHPLNVWSIYFQWC